MNKTILSDIDIEFIIRRDYEVPKSSSFAIIKEGEDLEKCLEKVPFFSLRQDLQQKFEHNAPYLWVPVVIETIKQPGDENPLQITFYEFSTKTQNIKKYFEANAE